MSEINKDEIFEVIKDMNALFDEKKYTNMAVLNALSKLSIHLAVVFGITKDEYLKDLEIMFNERTSRDEQQTTQ